DAEDLPPAGGAVLAGGHERYVVPQERQEILRRRRAGDRLVEGLGISVHVLERDPSVLRDLDLRVRLPVVDERERERDAVGELVVREGKGRRRAVPRVVDARYSGLVLVLPGISVHQ